MEVQQRISQKLNDAKVGNIYRTIIDRIEGDYYVGRTEHDSPEVDIEVLIEKSRRELTIGKFYDVRIVDAAEFDLIGIIKE
jgi:ribosomal protein S12 methylthiotransferase